MDDLTKEETAKLIAIPAFNGDRKDPLAFKQFARKLNQAQKALGWSDKKTAVVATMKLTDQALAFFDDKEAMGETGLDEWDPPVGDGGIKPPGLKALLTEWYDPPKTIAEIAVLQRTMVQKQHEYIKDFYTRLSTACFTIEQVYYPEEGRKDHKAQYMVSHNAWMFAYFIQGMRDRVQQEVLQIKPKTLKEAYDAARRYEDSPDGIKELKGSGMKIAAANLTTSPTGAEQQVKSTKRVHAASNGLNCEYCGIEGHEADQCRRKAKDVEKGLVRDRHPGYPMKARSQMDKAEKKKAGKQKKVASASISNGHKNQQQSQQQQQPQQQQQAAANSMMLTPDQFSLLVQHQQQQQQVQQLQLTHNPNAQELMQAGNWRV